MIRFNPEAFGHEDDMQMPGMDNNPRYQVTDAPRDTYGFERASALDDLDDESEILESISDTDMTSGRTGTDMRELELVRESLTDDVDRTNDEEDMGEEWNLEEEPVVEKLDKRPVSKFKKLLSWLWNK
jgi:hypothetical protein